MTHLKVLSFALYLIFSLVLSFTISYSPVRAETCLDVYRGAQHYSLEGYLWRDEIALAEEIQNHFDQKTIEEVTDIIASSEAYELPQLSSITGKYLKKISQISSEEIVKTKRTADEIRLALVLHYFKKDFCQNPRPLKISEIVTSFCVFVPKSGNPVLNEFRKRERDKGVLCPTLDAMGSCEWGIETEKWCTVGAELKKQDTALENKVGFKAAGQLFYLDQKLYHLSGLEKIFQDSHWEGNLKVLQMPKHFASDQEFQEAITLLVESVEKNRKIPGIFKNSKLISWLKSLGLETLFWPEQDESEFRMQVRSYREYSRAPWRAGFTPPYGHLDVILAALGITEEIITQGRSPSYSGVFSFLRDFAEGGQMRLRSYSLLHVLKRVSDFRMMAVGQNDYLIKTFFKTHSSNIEKIIKEEIEKLEEFEKICNLHDAN